jgi:hypothetical protein
MEALAPREREVIERRFGLGRPPEGLAQIGRSFGVSRERVRQIEARALDKLHEVAVPGIPWRCSAASRVPERLRPAMAGEGADAFAGCPSP